MPSPFACKSMMEYRDHTHAVFNLHTHHDMNSVTEKELSNRNNHPLSPSAAPPSVATISPI
jgi:hypothetical protein